MELELFGGKRSFGNKQDSANGKRRGNKKGLYNEWPLKGRSEIGTINERETKEKGGGGVKR